MATVLLQLLKLAADSAAVQTGAADAPPPVPQVMSVQEISLSSQILLFSLAVLLIEAGIIKITAMDSRGAIRLVTVTLILTCTIYLITAGYSNQKTAGATGLLGTIAGYLLGNSTLNQTPNKPPDNATT